MEMRERASVVRGFTPHGDPVSFPSLGGHDDRTRALVSQLSVTSLFSIRELALRTRRGILKSLMEG